MDVSLALQVGGQQSTDHRLGFRFYDLRPLCRRTVIDKEAEIELQGRRILLHEGNTTCLAMPLSIRGNAKFTVMSVRREGAIVTIGVCHTMCGIENMIIPNHTVINPLL